MTKDLLSIFRKKMHWLEGFAAAIESKALSNFVQDARRLLNEHEADQQQPTGTTAAGSIASDRYGTEGGAG